MELLIECGVYWGEESQRTGPNRGHFTPQSLEEKCARAGGVVMFEQSTLESARAAKRFWTTCVGMAWQAALVSFAVLAPMLWPQILPRATFAAYLVPPGPPPPPPPAGSPAVRPRVRTATTQFVNNALVAPATIPARPVMIEDTEPEPQTYGVPGGVPGGSRDGVANGVLDTVMRAGSPAIAPPTPSERPVAAAPAASAAPIRVRQGGLVKPAVVVHRVEPQYPEMARKMRVAGVVELEGVIGTDGRLRELRVVNGHPLLARAALEAVRQWIYAPTTLNGDPVEVIAPITVTFRLN